MKKNKYFYLFYKLIKLSSPYKLYLIAAIIISGLQAFTYIGIGWFNKNLVDYAVKRNYKLFVYFAFLGVFIYIAELLFRKVSNYLVSCYNVKTASNLRNIIIKNYIMAKYKEIEKYKTGDIEALLLNDVDTATYAISSNAVNFLLFLFMFIGSFTYLFSLNKVLTLLFLIPGFLTVITGFLSGHFIEKLQKAAMSHYSDAISVTQEVLSNYKIIKIYNSQKILLNHAISIWIKTLKRQFNVSIILNINNFFNEFMMRFSSLLIFALGGYYAYKGLITPGSIVTFLTMFGNILQPFNLFSYAWTSFVRGMVSADRIFKIVDLEKEVTVKKNAIIPQDISDYDKNNGINNHDIAYLSFDNVSFDYNDRKTVLNNINFKIHKGERISIVGVSGSGKSTIIKLLLRFYENYNGSISYNGINILDMDINEWRDKIAIVPQDNILFTGTVKDNVIVGKQTADDEEINNAINIAGARDFINSLPNGIDTVLSERGSSLSGGQKQRIGIARAILKDAQIIIFDEAMSELDPEMEEYINTTMSKYLKNKTIISITHRMASTAYSDKIYVLEDGKIVEQGKFDELMNIKGTFYKLYTTQLVDKNKKAV